MGIKKMREQRGLTQKQLAELIETDQRQISRWELRKHRPSVDTLAKIADVLNCYIVDLL